MAARSESSTDESILQRDAARRHEF